MAILYAYHKCSPTSFRTVFDTPPPRGRIRIGVNIEGEQVKVEIEDSGSGLPAESLPNIFDPFSQVNSPLNRASTGGLGLGLSLVKGLVEMHGGSVRAESPGIGRGSTFSVRLPRSNAAVAARLAVAPVAAKTASRRRVLIVDDNYDAAASLAALLEILGHDVRQAHSGLEAIDTALTFGPEFIFMDLGMPEMSGIEASRRIRQLKLASRPLIVALTGFGQEADRHLTAAAGIDEHLVKPAEINHIASLLNGGAAARH